MDNSLPILANVRRLLQVYKVALILGCTGLVVFGYGLFAMVFPQKKQETFVFTPGNESTESMKTEKVSHESPIMIDVAGAVSKPGVYELPSDARVRDAILAAGGMVSDADHASIAKTINLAAKLIDGAKLYVPFFGESTNPTSSTSSLSGEEQHLVNINTASESELDTLPGIGSVTAGKIINNRPYAAIDELLSKKIVSEKVFAEIKDNLTVY